MAMNKSFLNVILLGFGFMFVFTAFQTMGNIQKAVLESIHDEDPSFNGDGYVSLAIIYAVFALCNWFAPSVITLTGPRPAMIIGAVTYLLFIMSFLIPKTWLLYVASVIIGMGAAIIWTAQGNYLTLNSEPSTITRNSGIFWAMMQCSMFFGNLFVYIKFLGVEKIDDQLRMVVFWTLTGVAILGIVFLFVLRPAVRNNRDDELEEAPGPVKALKKAMKLFLTRDMLLLSLTFFYTGIELSFYSGVYSSSIGFTKNLGNQAKQLIGMSGIFIGLGEVIAGTDDLTVLHAYVFVAVVALVSGFSSGGGLFGILGSKTIRWGRSPIVVAGFVIHIVAFFLIFLNLPNAAPLGETTDDAFITTNGVLAVACSFLLGFGDSCYNTQIYSTLGGVFANDSASAFALFKFVQSCAAAACFFYSTSVGLYYQLGILIVLATIGTISFCLVEWWARPTPNVPDTADDSDSNANKLKP